MPAHRLERGEQLARRPGGAASSIVNGPTAVRRRLRRWAPPPSRRPRSAASVRTYVPPEHVDVDAPARPGRRSPRRRSGRPSPAAAPARPRCPRGPARAAGGRRPGSPTPSAAPARCRRRGGRRRRAGRRRRVTPGHVVGGDDGAVGVEACRSRRRARPRRCSACGRRRRSAAAGSPIPTPTTSTPVALGVERAGVADAALAEAPPQHADDVVAGDAGRLVDDGQPVDGRRASPRHRSGGVAGRVRRGRSRRMSSMRSAARITSSGRNTRTGVFLVRIWRLIDDWIRRRCSSSASRIGWRRRPRPPASRSRRWPG